MRHLSRTLAGLAASAAIALTATAALAEQQACGAGESWAQLKHRVESAIPLVVTHDVSDTAKDKLVESYNATPPVLSVNPDRVRFMLRPDNPAALVVFSKGSCVLGAAYIPVGLLVRILASGPKGVEV
jgi:hypothetical protein